MSPTLFRSWFLIIGSAAALAGSTLFFTSATAFAQPSLQNYSIRFSTFLGGSDKEMVRDIAFDVDRNFYAVGGGASTDFPIISNSGGFVFDDTQNGGWDVFVTKYTSQGVLLWSTFIGGPGYDRAYAVDSAPDGGLYIAGRAGIGFPVTAGALQTSFSGGRSGANDPYFEQDGFVCRMSSEGEVSACTYFGAADGRIIRDIAIGPAGEVYIAGSYRSGPYPAAIDQARLNDPYGGNEDVFIARLSADLTSALWLRFIDGNANDQVMASLGTDAVGNVFVASTTTSSGLATPGAYDESHGGGNDVFIAKLTSAGDLTWLTYLGGSGDDFTETHELAVAGDGTVTVAISSNSPHDSFATDQATIVSSYGPGGSTDVVVAQVAAQGDRISALTFIGGTAMDFAEGSALDGTGAFYFTGNSQSADFPITGNAIQSENLGLSAIVVKLSKRLETVFASYLGGASSGHQGRGIAADLSGDIFLGGQTASGSFFTQNAAQPQIGGGNTDGFIEMLQTPLSCGDLGGNGSVTANDALEVLQAAVGLSACDVCICDVDASGEINTTDALATLQFAVGVLTQLACVACP